MYTVRPISFESEHLPVHGVIFTCLLTRAVRLEVVPNLSGDCQLIVKYADPFSSGFSLASL